MGPGIWQVSVEIRQHTAARVRHRTCMIKERSRIVAVLHMVQASMERAQESPTRQTGPAIWENRPRYQNRIWAAGLLKTSMEFSGRHRISRRLKRPLSCPLIERQLQILCSRAAMVSRNRSLRTTRTMRSWSQSTLLVDSTECSSPICFGTVGR